jgi:tRNA(fMet)-specific endonuclease VapC
VPFLFDTDIVSNLFKKQPSPVLQKRLSVLPRDQQFISAITVYEMLYGGLRSAHPEKHLHNLKKVLLPMVQVLSFDEKAAFQAAEIRTFLEKKGTSIDLPDLQIAAIARSNNCTLVTANLRHFREVPDLKMENWLG